MRKMTMKFLTLILSVSMFSPVFAVELITGDAAAPASFSQGISVKAFDRYTGTMYVGLDAIATTPAFSIASAGRSATAFTGLADDAGLQVISTHMGIMNNAGLATTHIAVRENTTGGLLEVIASTGGAALAGGARGTAAGAVGNICDTAGAAAGNDLANAFTLIEGGFSSTLGYGLIFLRVMATAGADGLNSGILAFKLTAGAGPLVRVGNWHTNNHAVRADTRISAAADNNNFLRALSTSLVLTTSSVVNDIYWDSSLEKLFVAGSVTTQAKSNFHSAILTTTVVGGHLGMNSIIPVAINAAPNDATTIFATDCNGGRQDPRILKIRTMHTSSDQVYLIVNGGIGDADANVGNQFYALRYDATDGHIVSNDISRAEAGTTKITRGSVLTDNFIRTGNAVVANNLDGGNVGSNIIGGMVTPWEVADPASDMEVVGDTVYVSYNANGRTAARDPGVWSSTAMFDKNGVIIGWTRWERVFTSDIAGVTDQTPFFAVDAYNNKLWRINNAATAVTRHAWGTTGFAATSLPGVINTAFVNDTHDDITAVLDIPTFTPGIGADANVHNSFVLVGGYERVVFAQTKSLLANAVTIDFSAVTANEDTTLVGAGTVRCLGFSRAPVAAMADNTKNNFFFAGTDLGLWVYCAADLGLGYNNAAGYTNLNAAPFDTYTWQHLLSTVITGAVTAIDSDGTYIYVVEQDVSTSGGIVSKLWRITIGETADEAVPSAGVLLGGMSNAANYALIAESGKDGIPVNTLFTGFSLATARDGALAGHVGILSTNAGALQSRVALSTLLVAGSNDASTWAGLDVARAYTAIKGIKRVPTTAVADDGAGFRFYGTAFEDSTNGYNYFQDSTLRLFGCTAAEIGDHQQYLIDTDVNGEFDVDTAKENRILSFWSDGGRRFATRFNGPDRVGSDSVNMLWAMPYSPAEWNMTAPSANTDTDDQRIYWVENISGLGIIMAGTTNGVIALQ